MAHLSSTLDLELQLIPQRYRGLHMHIVSVEYSFLIILGKTQKDGEMGSLPSTWNMLEALEIFGESGELARHAK